MLGLLWFSRERTRSYTVHEQPRPPADRIDRAEALAFVKDGFSWPAFILPELWLISRGIWLGLLAFVALVVAILALSSVLGVPPSVQVGVFVLVHLVFGNEADEIQRAHLATQGWAMIGQVTGTGPLDCERRFFDTWLPSVPMVASAAALDPGTPARSAPPLTPASWRAWRPWGRTQRS